MIMFTLNNTILAVFFVLISFISNGQITDAKVVYEVKMDSDDPMLSQQLSMMTGSTMTMFFKENNFRQDMDMNMMKSSTVYNEKRGEGIVLMEWMGLRKGARIDSLLNSKNEEKDNNASVEVTDEKKTIAGFECSKVIVEDSSGMEMIMYVTDEIEARNNKNTYGNSKVKGFPLKIEMDLDQLSMTLTATQVAEKVKKSMFDTKIPDGYEIVSYEALMQLMQGMN